VNRIRRRPASSSHSQIPDVKTFRTKGEGQVSAMDIIIGIRRVGERG
jgi:hypothetical protein